MRRKRVFYRRTWSARLWRCVAPPGSFNVFLLAFTACLVVLFLKASVNLAVEIPPSRKGQCEHFGWRPAAPSGRRVFDTFAFNSEYFALEARLHELSDVVDYFVLVEATRAFSGKPKPLFFATDANATRWKPFIDKIIHVALDDSAFAGVSRDPVQAAVDRKVITKSSVLIGLNRARARPDDLVIFSDLDEIPAGHVIGTLRSCTGYGLPVSIHSPQYIYDFGCPVAQPPYWEKIRLLERKQLDEQCLDWAVESLSGASCVDHLRDNPRVGVGLLTPNPLSVRYGGWHISYFMSIDKIVEKLESISHIERNTPHNKRHDYLQCLKCKCRHVGGRETGVRAAAVDYSAVGPDWVRSQARDGILPFVNWYPNRESVCGDPSILAVCG